MTNSTTLSGLRQQIAPQPMPAISMDMNTVAGFESMQRAAKLFASSNIVPTSYQGEKGLPNCFIAIDMALRMGANPLLVMQNLYIVHGNPAWSAQFLIATFNKCGRFSAIRYEFSGTPGTDDWGCRAVAIELATKEKLAGPLVTIGLAKKEGWYGKNGSKWQSMPEMMLRYRAAAWFVRAYAPEIAMGLKTADEEEDKVITVEATSTGGTMTLDDLAAGRESRPEDKKAGKRRGKALAEKKTEAETPPETQEAPTDQTGEKDVAEQPASANAEDSLEDMLQGDNKGDPPDGTHLCQRYNEWVNDAYCEQGCEHKSGCQDYWPQDSLL